MAKRGVFPKNYNPKDHKPKGPDFTPVGNSHAFKTREIAEQKLMGKRGTMPKRKPEPVIKPVMKEELKHKDHKEHKHETAHTSTAPVMHVPAAPAKPEVKPISVSKPEVKNQ